MFRAVIVLAVVGLRLVKAPPPVRLTIDCSSLPKNFFDHSNFSPKLGSGQSPPLQVGSFCRDIHNAIPQAVKNGKFVLVKDEDQSSYGSEPISISVAPPNSYIPKIKTKIPRIKVPKFKVPHLKSLNFDRPLLAPRIGKPMRLGSYRDSVDQESSAERMEKFKKGVQKMLHVVKVLGQIDQYLSERTRIVVEKLAKTFSDD